MTTKPIGPYVIEKLLATGGMAEVFVAMRKGPHGFSKRVALKRILPQFAREPNFVSMFVDEARLAAQLMHPNIVQVFDFGEQDGELFLAMELVDGTNVNRLLRAAASRQQSVPLEVALHIVSQTAHALAYAHRAQDPYTGQSLNIVHRDVSPANILLTGGGHVKLSDFGIARMAGAENHTDAGHVRGKLGYMSPEQVMGKDLDGRSDVFTLSTVFAEMLLARPLFGSGNDLDVLLRIRDVDLEVISKHGRSLPKDVVRVLQEGLAPNPEERLTASALARTVDDILRRRGVARAPERLGRLLYRHELVGTESVTDLSSVASMKSLQEQDDSVVERLKHTAQAKAPYRVQFNGDTHGPMSFAQLVEMIMRGLVTSNTPISKQDSEFERASEYPELTRFVSSHAMQWQDHEVTGARWKGNLKGAPLLSVVHQICTLRKTGALHLVGEYKRKKIYFVDGKPEFVSSTDRQELLGEFLIRNSTCLRMEVEMALALLPRYGGRLGDALVGMGILRPVELFRAIHSQVHDRYVEAFRWTEGLWAFAQGKMCNEETFPLGHDTRELLRDAAQVAPVDGLLEALSPIYDKPVALAPNPPAPVGAYRLPDQWQRLLDLSKPVTLHSVVQRETKLGTIPLQEVYRAFYLAVSCELLQVA